jgi:hypothetical protein
MIVTTTIIIIHFPFEREFVSMNQGRGAIGAQTHIVTYASTESEFHNMH